MLIPDVLENGGEWSDTYTSTNADDDIKFKYILGIEIV
jgi:hypothetical protein